MKNIWLIIVAVVAMAGCSDGAKAPFSYRGLPLSMKASEWVDSMTARGFAVDSAASDSGRTVIMTKKDVKYRVLAAVSDDRLQVIQDMYYMSTNDSTRRMWQQLRDDLEKELGAWPDCPMLKDDHKVANFDAGDGIIAVILKNTYTPTLTVRYTPKKE